MSGVTLKTCITVYIMAAAFTLVAAVPTPSTSATTTSQELESENAVSTAAPAVLAFNQSQCSTNGGSAAVNFSLCLGHFAVGKYLEVSIHNNMLGYAGLCILYSLKLRLAWLHASA